MGRPPPQMSRERRPPHPELSPALQLWLKTDSLQLKDDQPVILWPDRSGRGHDRMPTVGVHSGGTGQPPKYVAASLVNGQPPGGSSRTELNRDCGNES